MDVDFDALTEPELRRRRSAKWQAYGEDVLPAWVAECDVPLAAPITAALRGAVEHGDTGYAYPGGLSGVVARWLAARWDWQVDPAGLITAADVMTGVADVLRIVTSPGDRVVIVPPVYPPFAATVRRVGRQPVEVPVIDDGTAWQLDLGGLQAAFRAGAAALLLCSPHNPLGMVWPRDTLAAAAALADRYGVFVLSDEIHAPLTLPGSTHTPYPVVSPAAERSVVFTSASKAWNLAGLKCAVIVPGSPAVRDRIAPLAPDSGWHIGHFGAIAAEAAFRDGGPWLHGFLTHLDRNRALLGELLAEHLPEVGYRPPAASYLAWLDCRALGFGDNPADVFLQRGRVALSAGADFGTPGRGYARLNIGTTAPLLAEAVRRMAAATNGQ
ncbi:MAG: MalY/PatB family protein [Mycobacteriales bacterium]